MLADKLRDCTKLNIGSGRELPEAYINFDAVKVNWRGKETDVIGTVDQLLDIFEEGRFTDIILIHVIEHFVPAEGRKLIEDCYKLLKPGGKLNVEGPNVMGIYELFKEGHHISNTEDKVIAQLYGGSNWGEYGWHRWGYTPDTAARLLEECGFKVTYKGIGMKHGMGKRDFGVVGVKE